ncbi:hypothetical protein QN277_002456 [Acacia crassicarpa]|uniref:Uncharacterized protein n=1 Tax=Acacia crassicarpa TaxID=499986 RepID=A0AAE1N9K2_9FABA|nr:hypothetical protein QN277_002456 [Acacia crassicarpa]
MRLTYVVIEHLNSKTTCYNSNSKAKSAASKRSTLMKPSSSQLAKQNCPPHIVGSRFQNLPRLNQERSVSIASRGRRSKLPSGRNWIVGSYTRSILIARPYT